MYIKDFVKDFKKNKTGIYSVCSSDEQVLSASIEQAAADGSPLLVEATCNQVNQYGGYTGMKPADYRDYVYSLACNAGFDCNQIILGGDHLGTQPFKDLNSSEAMEKALDMVKLYADAGFTKLHLDASVRCEDDRELSIDEFEILACERVAEMAQIAGKSSNAENISYIIGTEVPTPGGCQEDEENLKPTSAEEAEKTLELSRMSFMKRDLQREWEKVCALVVQPGVEFSDSLVHQYDRTSAGSLSSCLKNVPEIVFEAHSTDYQTDLALQQLVEDGFSILKVGPALTYAKHQAVFALGRIEKELIQPDRCSEIDEVIEQIMTSNPGNWISHYHGNSRELKLARKYSYSDRLRYYWPDKDILSAMSILITNLSEVKIPHTLLYEYMPMQYWYVRKGFVKAKPLDLINHHIQLELKRYSIACGFSCELDKLK